MYHNTCAQEYNLLQIQNFFLDQTKNYEFYKEYYHQKLKYSPNGVTKSKFTKILQQFQILNKN